MEKNSALSNKELEGKSKKFILFLEKVSPGKLLKISTFKRKSSLVNREFTK